MIGHWYFHPTLFLALQWKILKANQYPAFGSSREDENKPVWLPAMWDISIPTLEMSVHVKFLPHRFISSPQRFCKKHTKASTRMGGKQNPPPTVSVHTEGTDFLWCPRLPHNHTRQMWENATQDFLFACQWQQPETAEVKPKSSRHGLITLGCKK